MEAAKVLYDAAVKAGAPENCIQWIETPSIQATAALMNHPGVSLILATGGAETFYAKWTSEPVKVNYYDTRQGTSLVTTQEYNYGDNLNLLGPLEDTDGSSPRSP